MMASAKGHCNVVSRLLDHKTIDANSQDEVFLYIPRYISSKIQEFFGNTCRVLEAGDSRTKWNVVFVALFLKLAASIFKFWMFFDLLMVM